MDLIERKPLQEQVANRLRDMIIEGDLAPGDTVNESRLCQDLGVSRTPIREAVRTLASEGLIVLRHGRSTVVRTFTATEVRGMLEVLAELEALAGRRACDLAEDKVLAEIADTHREMMVCYAARDRLSYYKLNQQIHSMIARASGNPALLEVHDLLQGRMKRIRFIGNSAPEDWRGAVEEHEEMIAALAVRDAERLDQILRLHMRRTWERVSAFL